MKQKIAVTLDEELVTFLDAQAKGNRSEYLNALLARERKQTLETEIITALVQDAQDANYQAEIADWDSVVGDGIDAER
jgi:Arc/MetJ-type ribon-helix-helix transcriptional regulator